MPEYECDSDMVLFPPTEDDKSRSYHSSSNNSNYSSIEFCKYTLLVIFSHNNIPIIGVFENSWLIIIIYSDIF